MRIFHRHRRERIARSLTSDRNGTKAHQTEFFTHQNRLNEDIAAFFSRFVEASSASGDQLQDGTRFRSLTMVDVYTRESVAIEAGQSLKGTVRVLNQVKTATWSAEVLVL